MPRMLYACRISSVMAQLPSPKAVHVITCQLSTHGAANESSTDPAEVKFHTAPSKGGLHAQYAPSVALYRSANASYSCTGIEQGDGVAWLTA